MMATCPPAASADNGSVGNGSPMIAPGRSPRLGITCGLTAATVFVEPAALALLERRAWLCLRGNVKPVNTVSFNQGIVILDILGAR
jgi:hypothetical protein